MQIVKTIHIYFLQRYSFVIRNLHYGIIILVIMQIFLSNFMSIDKNQKLSGNIFNYLFSWIHIGLGILAFCITVIFVAIELKKYGLKYFYSYLYGDFIKIKSDLSQMIRFKSPSLEPRGVVASIEGLGLGALLLTTLSGMIWFILWINHSSLSLYVQEFHKFTTTFLEIYIVGHGTMALVHIFTR